MIDEAGDGIHSASDNDGSFHPMEVDGDSDVSDGYVDAGADAESDGDGDDNAAAYAEFLAVRKQTRKEEAAKARKKVSAESKKVSIYT